MLDEKEFSSGTNWKWCKKCKSHKVLLRSYEKKDPQAIREFQHQSRFEFFQDFIAGRAYKERMLRVTSTKIPGTKRNPQWRLHLALASLILDNRALLLELEDWRQDQMKRRRRDSENSKARQLRKDFPEIVRASERAKREKNPLKYKAASSAKSAAARGARKSTVALNLVWDLAEGNCGICGEPCDPEWWHVDHVLPIAAGGMHTLENLAPAHPYCNLSKGKKTNDELDIQWLRDTRRAWESGEAGHRMRFGGQAPCGTTSRYFKGCRCDLCRAARAKYERERRARVAKPPAPRVPRVKLHANSDKYVELRLNGRLKAVARRETGLTVAQAKLVEP